MVYGEIKSGKEIGRRWYSEGYILCHCPQCGRDRWIINLKIPSPIRICQKCQHTTAMEQWRNISSTPEGNIVKKCTICKRWLPYECFTNNKSTWDNKEHYCRECNTIKTRKYREQNRERINAIGRKSYQKNKHKQYARSIANQYIHYSQICTVDGCCEIAQKHHPDYDKPLDIVWLCRKHHSFLHPRK